MIVSSQSDTAKYLGMALDAKLHWKAHVKKKSKDLGLKYKNVYEERRPTRCNN
jgi:inhibitor of KinA sporulation pathway (predicted exonuclease)